MSKAERSTDVATSFFDMDDTLLAINTGVRFGKYLKHRQEIGWLDLWKTLFWGAAYKFSLLDLDALLYRLCIRLAGMKEADFCKKIQPFLGKEVFPYVLADAVDCLSQHEEAGHVNVLLTSALSYMAEPVAALLGIKHVLCTRIEVKDGVFTGKVHTPACFGEGKVFYANQFLKQHGMNPQNSFFYTDSYSDISMLRTIGHPMVVNPDHRLLRYARKHHWPVLNWERLASSSSQWARLL